MPPPISSVRMGIGRWRCGLRTYVGVEPGSRAYWTVPCRSFGRKRSGLGSVDASEPILPPAPLSRRGSFSTPSGLSRGPDLSSHRRRPRLLWLWIVLGVTLGLAVPCYYLVSSDSIRGNPTTKPLSRLYFIPLRIDSVEPVTTNTSVFSLSVPLSAIVPYLSRDPRPIQSLYIHQPDLQIQRAYTPLDLDFLRPIDEEGGENLQSTRTIKLLVKRYADGEVSSWLHRLRPGDEVGVRGMEETLNLNPEDLGKTGRKIVLLAGGTGITPCIQFIRNVLDRRRAEYGPLEISLLYSNAKPTDILLKEELENLRRASTETGSPCTLSIKYAVDRVDRGGGFAAEEPPKRSSYWPSSLWNRQSAVQDSNVKGEPGIDKVGRLGLRDLESWIGRPKEEERSLIIICGPDGMINHLAGPRQSTLGPGAQKGPIGGVLGQLGWTNEVGTRGESRDEIWKL